MATQDKRPSSLFDKVVAATGIFAATVSVVAAVLDLTKTKPGGPGSMPPDTSLKPEKDTDTTDAETPPPGKLARVRHLISSFIYGDGGTSGKPSLLERHRRVLLWAIIILAAAVAFFMLWPSSSWPFVGVGIGSKGDLSDRVVG
ncbi:MAG: hypothetical protein LBI99_04790, partial [Propionibacteriaceae bacterium]|nr:hypothetical protein [Propionibacteriaceae bacterium]